MFFLGLLSVVKVKDKQVNGVFPVQFLGIWFLFVFLFFSGLHVVISHYVLVLSTPFAILTAYIWGNTEKSSSKTGIILETIKKYYGLFWITLGVFLFVFLVVFLAGYPKYWLAAFLIVYAFSLLFIVKQKDARGVPFCLAGLIVFVFSQTAIMEKASVTPH